MEKVADFSGVTLANGRASAAKTGTAGIQDGLLSAGSNSDAWMHLSATPPAAPNTAATYPAEPGNSSWTAT